MEKILFIAHSKEDGSLGKAALEALTMALGLKDLGELAVGLFGGDVAPAADAVAGCGAAKILGASSPDLAVSRYATDAAAVEALCKAAGATIVIAPATSRMSRVLPGVAERLGGRADTQITEIKAENGAPQITRWYYRQRMFSEQSRSQRPWIMTVAPGCCPAYDGAPGSASVEAVAVSLGGELKKTTVVGIEAPSADEQTIRPDAEVLFVAGAGWTKKQADGQPHLADAEKNILGFIGAAKASLGSSKSLVDLSGEGHEVLSFMTHLHQVGQTGATPRHPKGLATCCHGEEPHVVGWRFINERRAVNLDANCGWAQGKADVLYVADAFEVMSKVNEMLKDG